MDECEVANAQRRSLSTGAFCKLETRSRQGARLWGLYPVTCSLSGQPRAPHNAFPTHSPVIFVCALGHSYAAAASCCDCSVTCCSGAAGECGWRPILAGLGNRCAMLCCAGGPAGEGSLEATHSLCEGVSILVIMELMWTILHHFKPFQQHIHAFDLPRWIYCFGLTINKLSKHVCRIQGRFNQLEISPSR